MPAVGYNADDPLQHAFLSALALGESGGSTNSYLGVGGTDLTGSATDAFGFPQWAGFGNSHAAGTYQFEPSTWDSIAQEYGLNFAHPQDQAAGAWYLAQQTDPTLYSDLSAGNFSKVQAALASIWPSVTGNGAAPQGLAADLTTALKAGPNNGEPWAIDWFGNGTAVSGNPGLVNKPAPGATPASGIGLPNLGGAFTQGALIVIGSVIVLVALWQLLSNQGYVPSPKQAVRAAF